MEDRYEPLPRWGHISVAIGDKMYMWGGRIDDFSDESQKKLASLVEVFDIQSELWEQRSTSGTPPKGLYNCAYTSIGNKIFVYGGWDGLTNHGSLHSLDVDAMQWEEVQANSSPDAPMKMSGCGLVSYGDDKLILFGGYGVPMIGQKVQGVRFKSSKESGSGEASGGASASSQGDEDQDTIKLLTNGDKSATDGEDDMDSDDEEMKAMTNEVKVFDLNKRVWSSPSVSGDCPPPCVDFSFTRVDEHRVVVFGGFQPEMGTTSDAYMLDMETWRWLRLGGETTSLNSLNIAVWPKGRDGHASCVLVEGAHPQVLVTGGWDKQNQLLYDAWVLDVTSGSWTELPGVATSAAVGGRFWHTVSSFTHSENLKQLVFFGGCPTPPNEAEGESWDKLADTILLEVGHIEPLSNLEPSFTDQGYSNVEWVVLDTVNHLQMGQPLRRLKEMVLFAEHRALRAETLAKDIMKKLDSGAFRRSLTPSMADHEVFASMASLNKDVPFWVVSQQDVEITPTEIGRGKWAIVRVARFRGDKIAAKCLTTSIFSEENRKLFIECMDLAARLHHHPNLLPFYGAVLEGEPIILTELMHCNLRVLADKNQLSYNQVTEIVLDVAKGLQFLHSTKPDPIIHGDLSCTSILVEQKKGNKWKAKLSDFMTAKFFKQLASSDSRERSYSLTRMRSRTRSFASEKSVSPPPQKPPPKRKESFIASDYQDAGLLTMEKDVYCYGLVLIEACTGSLPVEISLGFLIESIRWPDINALVKDCLNLVPDKRPDIATIIDRLTVLLHAVSIKSVR